jgi:hypothetical protein
MKSIRTSKVDSVLDDVEKTYPSYNLCSYENLARINGKLKITNPPRFWNERSHEVLSAVHDINVTFHRYPDSHKQKILASKEIETLFHSQIFTYLESKIRDSKKASPEETAIMVKICSNFMKIGLSGLLKLMPSDFTHILEPKTQELFTLMNAINEYTNRISPRHAKTSEFPFDLYTGQ